MTARRRLRVPLIALAAAGTMFALLVVNVFTQIGVHGTRTWITRARDIQNAITRTRSALVDAESGQRGYLLTGDVSYLEPFGAAKANLPELLAVARKWASADPDEAERIRELERLVSAKMTEVANTIDLYQKGQREQALAIFRDKRGETIMNDVRRLVAELRAHEDRLLEARTAAARRNLDIALWFDAIAVAGLIALGFMLLSIHRDLARREVLETALRDAARAQEQLIGIVSHDLRNPVSAISMATTMLERRGGLPAGAERDIKRIASSSTRMMRMLTQLLDHTRTQAGSGIPVDRHPGTNLSELVGAAVDELRAAHPETELTLDAQDGIVGDWDPDRMAQVVSNLVGNAIAYGGGSLIEVRLRNGNGTAVLEVHNGGAPIASEALASLFKPFQGEPGQRKERARGLGLGLFISQQIVLRHGGTIDVRSEATDGTTFRVELPTSKS